MVLGNTAWSVKTTQSSNPVSARQVRLISGRNSPTFSFGTDNPFTNLQETGRQVLEIWNARVGEATQQYPHLRTIVLIRDIAKFRFKVFEFATTQFDPADYLWGLNKKNNFEGRSVQDQRHAFTWQPSGSQFTILRPVSGSARSFQVRKPDEIAPEELLTSLGYSDDWVSFL